MALSTASGSLPPRSMLRPITVCVIILRTDTQLAEASRRYARESGESDEQRWLCGAEPRAICFDQPLSSQPPSRACP
ncbi:hypothetical protein L209DRAFT_747488 [Thermothelomyces heterothallicus CBS 203.75]